MEALERFREHKRRQYENSVIDRPSTYLGMSLLQIPGLNLEKNNLGRESQFHPYFDPKIFLVKESLTPF